MWSVALCVCVGGGIFIAKNTRTIFLYFLLYLCIIAIRWRLAIGCFAYHSHPINIKTFTI